VAAMLVNLRKVADDGRVAQYWLRTVDGPRRLLNFDRVDERVWPEDGNRDAIFRAAATKISAAWLERGELPENLAHQA
jgi:hypothetical protein